MTTVATRLALAEASMRVQQPPADAEPEALAIVIGLDARV